MTYLTTGKIDTIVAGLHFTKPAETADTMLTEVAAALVADIPATAASAGVAEASKVPILGATKNLDTLDLAELKIGGVKVDATPAEIDQALDGIGANVTPTNLDALTGGAVTGLHQHNLADGADDVTISAANLNILDDGDFTALHKHLIAYGTPVNAVGAAGVLTIAGVVNDAETVTIDNPAIAGTDVYEFDATGGVTPGNIAADISGGTKTQATARLSLAGTVADGETFTISTEVYEIDTNGAVTGGNIAVDVSASAVAAAGTLTFTGVVADGETVTIGAKVFEFDTNGVWTAGNVRVNVAGDQTAPFAVAGLVAAISLTPDAVVTAADGAGDTVVVTHKIKGAAGNAVGTTETCTNASWGGATLAGGSDCSAANAETAIASAFNAGTALAITAAGWGGGDAVDFTCDAAGLLDGSAGNTTVTTETMANGSFAAGVMSGGSDCTAAEAVTALAAAMTASDTQGVGGADGAGDTVDVTADTRGVAGNAITTTETMTNGSFAAGVLAGGVDGTTGTQWEAQVDASYLYLCVAAQTIADRNWRRVSLGAAY